MLVWLALLLANFVSWLSQSSRTTPEPRPRFLYSPCSSRGRCVGFLLVALVALSTLSAILGQEFPVAARIAYVVSPSGLYFALSVGLLYSLWRRHRPRPRLNFVVQHLLVSKEALFGCFVAMSFSWSVVEVFGD